VAELLARFADRRRVDDGHQLRQVLDEHAVEEHLVAIQQSGEADVALQITALVANVLELQLDLLFDRLDRCGQQSVQAESIALFVRERQPLVGRWVLQQPDSAFSGSDRIRAAQGRVVCIVCHGRSPGPLPDSKLDAEPLSGRYR